MLHYHHHHQCLDLVRKEGKENKMKKYMLDILCALPLFPDTALVDLLYSLAYLSN